MFVMHRVPRSTVVLGIVPTTWQLDKPAIRHATQAIKPVLEERNAAPMERRSHEQFARTRLDAKWTMMVATAMCSQDAQHVQILGRTVAFALAPVASVGPKPWQIRKDLAVARRTIAVLLRL
jgi:hypothetical protein